MSSLDPIAKNDVWATMAALARRLRALESVGGAAGFQTGDILASVKTHPDMLTTTLSDGGRPGWWLLNGATDPNMQTTDPKLFELLGANVLKSAKGRVVAGPDGASFVALAEIGAESDVVPGAPAHTHTFSGSVTGQGGFGVQSGTSGTVQSGTNLGVSGSVGSGGGGGGGTVSRVQPTLVAGSVWIKR